MALVLRQLGRVRVVRGMWTASMIVGIALSTFAVVPASAQASNVWTLDCKGNSLGGASWTWLLNGAPIAGASQTAGCADTNSLTGTVARPSSANGLMVQVSAGGDTNTITKSFDPTGSVSVREGAHLNAFGTFCLPDSRTCFQVHSQEGEHFSLDA